MKIPLLLLALAAATPALSITPIASAPVNVPAIEAPSLTTWEFTPDFLRDQSRISWSAPNVSGAGEFFVATTNGTGAPASERVHFPDADGKILATPNVTLDKRNALQRIELRNIVRTQMVLPQVSLTQPVTLLSIEGSAISLQTIIADGLLAKRTFALKFPNMTGTLVCQYDARGRRQRDILTANGAVCTINYAYDARGLSQITDGATNFAIERDADGKMRALSAIKNGLLARSATPIAGDKGAIIGTRVEDYQSGILREVNQWTQTGGAKNNRTNQSSSDTTSFINGQQSTERKFEFRRDIGPKPPAVAAIESRKREVYKNGKMVTEELFRGGILTQRSEFNDNGVISKVTNFNANGSVISETDTGKIPYADGGVIRRENATN